MNTKKTLTLQIHRPNFEYILTGEQKTEHRDIYPSNVNRYVNQTVDADGNVTATCVQYDALRLINGRRKDAPSLIVEVKSAEWVYFTDKEGRPLTYVENGKKYLVAQVWYRLGKVLRTDNVGEDFEFKYAGKIPYEYAMDDRPREEITEEEAKEQGITFDPVLEGESPSGVEQEI